MNKAIYVLLLNLTIFKASSMGTSPNPQLSDPNSAQTTCFSAISQNGTTHYFEYYTLHAALTRQANLDEIHLTAAFNSQHPLLNLLAYLNYVGAHSDTPEHVSSEISSLISAYLQELDPLELTSIDYTHYMPEDWQQSYIYWKDALVKEGKHKTTSDEWHPRQSRTIALLG